MTSFYTQVICGFKFSWETTGIKNWSRLTAKSYQTNLKLLRPVSSKKTILTALSPTILCRTSNDKLSNETLTRTRTHSVDHPKKTT